MQSLTPYKKLFIPKLPLQWQFVEDKHTFISKTKLPKTGVFNKKYQFMKLGNFLWWTNQQNNLQLLAPFNAKKAKKNSNKKQKLSIQLNSETESLEVMTIKADATWRTAVYVFGMCAFNAWSSQGRYVSCVTWIKQQS